MPFLSNLFGKKGEQPAENDPVAAVRNLYGVPGGTQGQAARPAAPASAAASPAQSQQQAAAPPQPAQPAAQAPQQPAPAAGGNDALDSSLRDLFASEAVMDPHMKRLMELAPEADVEELIDELREFAAAIGMGEEDNDE